MAYVEHYDNDLEQEAKIKCIHCEWQGLVSDLESDTRVNHEWEEWWCSSICPNCGKWQEHKDYLIYKDGE